jgi:hypothetical protein
LQNGNGQLDKYSNEENGGWVHRALLKISSVNISKCRRRMPVLRVCHSFDLTSANRHCLITMSHAKEN